MCYGAHFQPIRVAIEEKNHTGKKKNWETTTCWNLRWQRENLFLVCSCCANNTWLLDDDGVFHLYVCDTRWHFNLVCAKWFLFLSFCVCSQGASHENELQWNFDRTAVRTFEFCQTLSQKVQDPIGYPSQEEEHKTMNFNGVICLFRRRKTSHFEINCWQSHQKVNYFGWGVKTNRS